MGGCERPETKVAVRQRTHMRLCGPTVGRCRCGGVKQVTKVWRASSTVRTVKGRRLQDAPSVRVHGLRNAGKMLVRKGFRRARISWRWGDPCCCFCTNVCSRVWWDCGLICGVLATGALISHEQKVTGVGILVRKELETRDQERWR